MNNTANTRGVRKGGGGWTGEDQDEYIGKNATKKLHTQLYQ